MRLLSLGHQQEWRAEPLEVQRWGNVASNHLERMNESSIQQLLFRSTQWPWKWTKFAKEAVSMALDAAALCEQEKQKFSVLREEHHLLKLETSELHKQRIADTERHTERYQTLKEECHVLTMELREVRQQRLSDSEQAKLISLELNALREERQSLLKQHDQMKSGVTTLFEFIRRNKAIDDSGKNIPSFPNIFRQ
jgi:hypothetical protein